MKPDMNKMTKRPPKAKNGRGKFPSLIKLVPKIGPIINPKERAISIFATY